MKYLIKLQLDLLTTDEVLREHNLTYCSVERMISLNFVPYPGMWLRIQPNVGSDEVSKLKYKSLSQMVTHKPGIFEIQRCIVDVDCDTAHDLEAILKPKMETEFDKFQAMKDYVEYFGFLKR